MALGSDTVAINGIRFSTPTTASYAPQSWGPQTTGVPQVSPTMPPFLGGATTQASGLEGVGGYGTAGNNALATYVAGQNPWNPRVSALPWAVGGLILALLALRHVHWRDTILEGAEERGELGPVRERAEEDVR